MHRRLKRIRTLLSCLFTCFWTSASLSAMIALISDRENDTATTDQRHLINISQIDDEERPLAVADGRVML